MAEVVAWGSISDSNSFKKTLDHYPDHTSDAVTSDYAHRRSYSEIPTPSNFHSYSHTGYAASSLQQHRVRRSSSWDLGTDPELKLKTRLASYKVFTLEGKVKSTMRKSFRWMKGKYNEIVYGFK